MDESAFMKAISSVQFSCSVVSDSLRPQGLWPTRLLCPCNVPGKNTGVGCHFLLQGNFPHLGIEPKSPVLQEDSLLLSHKGSPLEYIPAGRIWNPGCCPDGSMEVKVTQLCSTLCDPMIYPAHGSL